MCGFTGFISNYNALSQDSWSALLNRMGDTIGFQEQGYNEAVYAKAIAQHLGTELTELYMTAQQAMEVIPGLPGLYNEPFSDSSQISIFLVSQLAKQHVTVSLSGDAGDELFCGYNRYVWTANLWLKVALLTLPLRRILAKGIISLSPDVWNLLTNFLTLFNSIRTVNIGYKLHKSANVLIGLTRHQWL